MLSTVFKVCALAALVDARQKFSPRQTAFTQTAEFLAAADEKGDCTKADEFEAACYEGAKDDAEKKAISDKAPKGKVIAKGAKKEDVKAACCPPAKSDGGSCGSSCR
ncbi:unnamed protein product [Amoebophrya sp. A25]|nr:unnamed protein product [Amoebophrya sp. A25]|eukprot:GSA25T00010635001.1